MRQALRTSTSAACWPGKPGNVLDDLAFRCFEVFVVARTPAQGGPTLSAREVVLVVPLLSIAVAPGRSPEDNDATLSISSADDFHGFVRHKNRQVYGSW